jgi:hypothetical protein
MVSDRAPEPALHVLTKNSDAAPGSETGTPRRKRRRRRRKGRDGTRDGTEGGRVV